MSTCQSELSSAMSRPDRPTLSPTCSGVPGLAATEMDILAATVSTFQKDSLMKFFRHHVNVNPCIECDMPVSNPHPHLPRSLCSSSPSLPATRRCHSNSTSLTWFFGNKRPLSQTPVKDQTASLSGALG